MRIQTTLGRFVAAGLGLLSFSFQAHADSFDKKQYGRSRMQETVPGEYIVKLKNSVGATEKAFRTLDSSGLSVVDTLNLRQNIHLVRVHDSDRVANTLGVNPAEVSQKTLQQQTVQLIGSLPEVEYIEPNQIYHALDTTDGSDDLSLPNDPKFVQQWGLHNDGQKDPSGKSGVKGADIHAPEAWKISTGSKRVVVAIIDTGIDYTHPDLVENLWVAPKNNPNDADVYGYNAISDKLDPMDDASHGTHCAGIIGASAGNNQGVVGVNWHVSLMASKFMSNAGAGTLSDAVKAIDWATNHGAMVMSSSWGGGGYSQALYDAIERARQKGILFITASGNDGVNNDEHPSYPANYQLDNIVSVAASTNQDQLAPFSNYGAKSVDLMAPGFNIISTVLRHSYAFESGTSMATPYVAGAAALLMAAEPGITYQEVKARLLSSTDKNRIFKSKVSSSGRLNVYNLLSKISPPGPISPPANSWGAPKAIDIHTPNPYASNSKLEWTIDEPGAKFIRVRFKSFNTENNYDLVKLFSESGEEADSYSGTLPPNTWSSEIEGSKAKITFESDASLNRAGFVIDAYEWTDYAGNVHSQGTQIQASAR